MGVKGLAPCYYPVSQVILCCTFMISELAFTLYWKNLIHTRISNPFSKCFLPSKFFFFLCLDWHYHCWRTSISYHGFLCVNNSYKRPCSTGVKYTERFSRQSFKRVPANSKVNLPWSVSMRFRTAKPSGTLLEISFSSSSSVPEVSYVNQGTCFKSHWTLLYLRELRFYFSWLFSVQLAEDWIIVV